MFRVSCLESRVMEGIGNREVPFATILSHGIKTITAKTAKTLRTQRTFRSGPGKSEPETPVYYKLTN